jgi:hypothetical protein
MRGPTCEPDVMRTREADGAEMVWMPGGWWWIVWHKGKRRKLILAELISGEVPTFACLGWGEVLASVR